MICTNCGSETHKIKQYGHISNCPYCPDKYIPKPIVGRFIRASLGLKSVGKRTAAHDLDISRRRLAEDGRTVIRDYGKKYFTIR